MTFKAHGTLACYTHSITNESISYLNICFRQLIYTPVLKVHQNTTQDTKSFTFSMHVQCHANICTESTVKHMVATEFLQLSKFQPLSSCLFPFNLPLPHEYLYAPCIDVFVFVMGVDLQHVLSLSLYY